MMDNQFLIIYRSSAGSGKTYTLTREYLRLAFSRTGNKHYRKILAVTFTNKAMQEMKDRIVDQLYEFSQGNLTGMGEELRQDFGMSEEEFQRASKSLLRDILHDYGHFSITTIDAFFQRVIRGFARELGLAGSYRLELDVDLTIHEIIQDLLAQVEDDPVLRQWLVDFSRHKLEEGSSWMVERHLESFTQDLLKEDFQVHEKEIRNMPREELHDLGKALKKEIARIRALLHGKANEVLRLMDEYGLTVNDFSYKGNGGVATFPSKVLQDNLEIGVRIRTAIEEDKYTGASEPQGNVRAALDSGLRAKFEELLHLVDTRSPAFITASQVLKNMYVFGLTIDILRKMNEYKQEHDLMFISDATRLLTELVTNTDALFIYEKVGAFYDHFLIDEFQDTSQMQWESFLPLVRNSLAEGNTNLIVGDVKQSIYRWRGGALELLQSGVMQEFNQGYIDLRKLGRNFRSAASVVEFNNALFNALPGVVSVAYSSGEDHLEEVASAYIGDIYHDAEQALKTGSENKGFVYARFVTEEKDEDDSVSDMCLSGLPAIIEELQDKGVPLSEIAILVRNNKEGKRSADILGEYARNHQGNGYRYDVISNDSLFLSGSRACRLIMAAMRFLHDPDNAINRAELTYLYYSVHDPDTNLEQLFEACGTYHKDREPTLPEQLVSGLSSWTKRPLIELVEKLIHCLGLDEMNGQFAYLQTFMDHVLKFVSRERGDASGLLDWWDERSDKESIKVPEDLDAIRIMTIHKSKGLEFHSVIIPYLKWKLDHERGPLLWLEGREDPVRGRVPVDYSKTLNNSHFAAEYQSERLKAYVDSLNLLYVALTRASHDLWMIAPKSKKKKKEHEIKHINEALLMVVEQPGYLDGGTYDPDTGTYTFGNRDFRFKDAGQRVDGEPVYLKKYTESNWRDDLLLKPVNQSLITSEQKVKINTGILIHNLLSRVRYTPDFGKVLAEVTWEEALSEEDVERIKQRILNAFERPEVKRWFSRKWRVMNEAVILTREGEYRPDRVMVSDEEVVVVDYKTGLQREKDIRQMQTYKDLLLELEGRPVSGFLWYIDLDEIIEV